MRKLIIIILMITVLFPIFSTTLSYAYNEVKEENKSGTSNAKQENTAQNNTIQNNISKENTVQNNTTKNNILEENITQNSTIEENAIKNNTTVEDFEKNNMNNTTNTIEEDLELVEDNIHKQEIKSDEIEEGTYYIKTKLNENMVFDIEGNTKNNKAKVQLWEKSAKATDNQKFKIKKAENDYYIIEAIHSEKVLDVPGAGAINGTRVQQYESNGTDAQKWIIKDAGDGYYYIISKCNGLYLDIPGANATNGIKINLYEGNNSNAQKFKLQKVKEEIETQTIENGTYYIKSKLNENIVFDIAGNSKQNSTKVQLWEKSLELTDNQKFEITYIGKGYYTIKAKHSKKVLDVPGAGIVNGTKVQQYESNGTDAQKWIIKEAGNGYYYIISKCNGLYLDIPGANAINGTLVNMYEGNNSDAQKFKLEKAKELVGTKTIPEGKYKIKMAINKDMVLDVDNLSRENGANIQLWEQSDLLRKNQRFEIKYLGNGDYQIIAQHSQKALSVQLENLNVYQDKIKNDNTQKWIIKDNQDGTYSIQSRIGGLFLGTQNAQIKNGSNIEIGNNSQKFIFEKLEEEKSEKLITDGVYKISTALDNNKVLDIDGGSYKNQANLQIWEKGKSQQQKFEITYKEEGYYEIKATHSGKVLDVSGGSDANGTNVNQYKTNNTEYQKWILKSAGNGYYYIISKGAEAYLSVAGNSSKNGTNVEIYDGSGEDRQKFKFEKIQIIDNDEYNISTALDSSKMLDVDLASSKLQIWELNQVSGNQRFNLKYLKDGYYKIICKGTNQVLTVKDDKVVQSKDIDSDNQKWKIETAKDGYFFIKSKSTSLYLDIPGGISKNGNIIEVHKKNGSNAQMFKFNNVYTFHGIDVSYFNNLINWLEVKRSNQVDFAMIRAAYRGYGTGKIVTDIQFERNLMQASASGIDIGIYFFTQAINEQEAIEEADYVINLLKKYNIDIKYPIVIDTENSGSTTNGVLDNEGRADKLSKEQRTNVCVAFCERIKSYGYTPMIYASRNWFYDNLDISRVTKYEHWVAHYTKDINKPTDYKYSYTMWQYTSEGSIPGIVGNVDLNVGYKKY